ncbi:cytochrome c [Motiliproteus sp. SC1-56]|uniref:c-type cytochrome n=1 Tax=Motiliproteus sp. SC1-56 TaxID=2799565 RepID=UPI001A90A9C9
MLLLGACSLPDDEERLAKQGLPPAGFEGQVEAGRELYAAHCAACHGRMMKGSRQGPPLLHKVYEPGHHADLAFYRAVKDGVVSHHWGFGDMPPQPQVSPKHAAHIIAYVRNRQRQVGIE